MTSPDFASRFNSYNFVLHVDKLGTLSLLRENPLGCEHPKVTGTIAIADAIAELAYLAKEPSAESLGSFFRSLDNLSKAVARRAKSIDPCSVSPREFLREFEIDEPAPWSSSSSVFVGYDQN